MHKHIGHGGRGWLVREGRFGQDAIHQQGQNPPACELEHESDKGDKVLGGQWEACLGGELHARRPIMGCDRRLRGEADRRIMLTLTL